MSKESSIKRLIAKSDRLLSETQALANRTLRNEFELQVLADEAAWGLTYHQRSLTSILEVLEDANEKAKGHKQAKPEIRKKARMGNRNVLNKPNN